MVGDHQFCCLECAALSGYRLAGQPDLRAGVCEQCHENRIVAPGYDYIEDEVDWHGDRDQRDDGLTAERVFVGVTVTLVALVVLLAIAGLV